MRARLGITVAQQERWPSPSAAFSAWREALENSGVLVFAFSMGSESCRGFSLWDDYAPILAVNTAWLPSARIFTTGRDSSQPVASSGLRPRTPTLTVNWSQAERGDRGIIELRPHRTSAGWTGAARL